MELEFSKTTIVILFLFGFVIVFVALFYPVNKKDSSPSVFEDTAIFEDSKQQVSDLFQVKESQKSSDKQPIPTDIPKDEACIIEGQTVREGTVSSNTICINETPSITPRL